MDDEPSGVDSPKVTIETRACTITIEGSEATVDKAYALWWQVTSRLSTREAEAGGTGFQVERTDDARPDLGVVPFPEDEIKTWGYVVGDPQNYRP